MEKKTKYLYKGWCIGDEAGGKVDDASSNTGAW